MSSKPPYDKQGSVEAPKTIIISQPNRKQQLLNDEPLTDEYLDSILPKTGYKICPPPANYHPVYVDREIISDESQKPNVQAQVPAEFQKLFTDLRPDEELSPEEQKERFVMRLLLDIKEGTVYRRKGAMRTLTNKALDFGAPLIFSKLLPLLHSNVLTLQERHSLIKAIDRLLYRLSGQMSQYVPQLLTFMSHMLTETDSMAKAEAREIISNLAKISGLPTVLHALKNDITNEDENQRFRVCQAIATAACAIGIPSIFPFVRACIHSKKTYIIRHAGIMIVMSIASQAGNGVLPFLADLVSFMSVTLEDEEASVVNITIKCITLLAENCAPYGGTQFEPILKPIIDGLNDRRHRNCLNCIGALLMTMEVNKAAYQFSQIQKIVIREFDSQSGKDKLTSLIVFKRALEKGAVDSKSLSDMWMAVFRSFWNNRAPLDNRLAQNLIATTTEIAYRYTVINVLEDIFRDFKTRSTEYRWAAVMTLSKILEKCSLNPLHDRTLLILNDCLLYGFEDIPENDERRCKKYLKCINAFVSQLGIRAAPLLDDVATQISSRLSYPKAHFREEASQILTIYTPYFALCKRQPVLVHFYSLVQELLAEEYPAALTAVLEAITAMMVNIPVEQLNPPPSDILPRLVPILKNRNEKVAYACIQLIAEMTNMPLDGVNRKEWMRIAYEVMEMLKAEKRKVREAAINAFGFIAQTIGPFDVLLALLRNLQVQERQMRVCVTLAIAVLAEKCGPYNILPPLMNEYRIPDATVQVGALKSLHFLFQVIGPEVANYCYAVVPLLTHALIERDPIHRQNACTAVVNFALGCFGQAKEDAMIHLFNHLMPNIFEPQLHFIDALMEALDAMRVALGPGIVLQYLLQGLFHPARKVRSQYWRVYNNMVIYSGDAMVPYYPDLNDNPPNNYHVEELDVFI